jgi:hypothetical protein
MRFILFASPGGTIQQSNAEVLAYLKLNAGAWGDA